MRCPHLTLLPWCDAYLLFYDEQINHSSRSNLESPNMLVFGLWWEKLEQGFNLGSSYHQGSNRYHAIRIKGWFYLQELQKSTWRKPCRPIWDINTSLGNNPSLIPLALLLSLILGKGSCVSLYVAWTVCDSAVQYKEQLQQSLIVRLVFTDQEESELLSNNVT